MLPNKFNVSDWVLRKVNEIQHCVGFEKQFMAILTAIEVGHSRSKKSRIAIGGCLTGFINLGYSYREYRTKISKMEEIVLVERRPSDSNQEYSLKLTNLFFVFMSNSSLCGGTD